MNEFAKRMQHIRRTCPGIAHLEDVMARLMDRYKIEEVRISDDEGGVQLHTHGGTDWTVKVIEMVLAIDGPIGLNLVIDGKYRWIGLMYDGPFDPDIAGDIIVDHSLFFPSELL